MMWVPFLFFKEDSKVKEREAKGPKPNDKVKAAKPLPTPNPPTETQPKYKFCPSCAAKCEGNKTCPSCGHDLTQYKIIKLHYICPLQRLTRATPTETQRRCTFGSSSTRVFIFTSRMDHPLKDVSPPLEPSPRLMRSGSVLTPTNQAERSRFRAGSIRPAGWADGRQAVQLSSQILNEAFASEQTSRPVSPPKQEPRPNSPRDSSTKPPPIFTQKPPPKGFLVEPQKEPKSVCRSFTDEDNPSVILFTDSGSVKAGTFCKLIEKLTSLQNSLGTTNSLTTFLMLSRY